MRRVTVEWQGRQVTGEELDWDVVSGEDWSKYKLADGTMLKTKAVIGRIVRLDERKEDGEPIYVVAHNLNVVAQVGPHLMEKN